MQDIVGWVGGRTGSGSGPFRPVKGGLGGHLSPNHAHRSSGSKVRYSTPQRRESGIDNPHTPISLNDCGRKMTKRDMCAGKVSLVDRNWFSRLLHVSVRAPAVTSICPQLSFSFSLFRERNLCEGKKTELLKIDYMPCPRAWGTYLAIGDPFL